MVATAPGDEAVIGRLAAKLRLGGLTLPQKYRILCSLRNCSNASATDALLLALHDSSALFRHDVAFALGQRQDSAAIDALKAVLQDDAEHGMVRHEAAEALGAIGTASCLQPVQQCEQCSVREVAETCVLASQRMAYFAQHGEADSADESKFSSVDPTPALPLATPTEQLDGILNDESAAMFERYRALFALRNQGGAGAVQAMARCLRRSGSALLKHEVAYVLGQMLDKDCVACLQACLQVRRTLRLIAPCPCLRRPTRWALESAVSAQVHCNCCRLFTQ